MVLVGSVADPDWLIPDPGANFLGDPNPYSDPDPTHIFTAFLEEKNNLIFSDAEPAPVVKPDTIQNGSAPVVKPDTIQNGSAPAPG